MTCATCHGRGVYDAWVTEFSYTPGDPPRDMAAADKGKQLRPCPDCTPKPFAEVGEASGSTSLFIAGRPFPIQWASPLELPELAERINAAVEARETKLRGNFAALRYLCVMAREAMIPTLFVDEVEEIASRDSDGLGPEYVIGDVACTYAFFLGMALDSLDARWRPLIDVLLERGGEMSTVAYALADHIGLDIPNRGTPVKALFPALFTDEQLLTEVARRGLPRVESSGDGRYFQMRVGVPMTATEAAVREANRRCQIYGCDHQSEPNSNRCWTHMSRPPVRIAIDPAMPGGDRTVVMAGTPVRPCPNCGRRDLGCGPSGLNFGGMEAYICRSMGPNEDSIIR